MTIKRKLFISDIMIILLPTLTVLICGFIAFLIIFEGKINYRELMKESNVKYVTAKEAEDLVDEDYREVTDDVKVYKNDGRDYVFVYENNDKSELPLTHGFSQSQRYVFLISVILLTVFIFLLNRFIAKGILKSIMKPLDILVNGVKEISGGNLLYRIDYKKEDEFTQVCTAFNRMAENLQDITLRQKKDELSRKILIAGISHDLRTPLTSIKAYVVGLENGIASSASMQKKYLSTISQKTADLEYIINQLFLFSKLDVGDFPLLLEKVNIYDEIDRLVNISKDEYREKGVNIQYDHLQKEVYCNIDVVQFENVIQNIWTNTFKYAKGADVVSIVRCYEEEGRAFITITDNGPGVPEEALDKLFDVFYRTDESRQNASQGSGLGLAISSRIINLSGGNISASNDKNGGLCIKIALPLQ